MSAKDETDRAIVLIQADQAAEGAELLAEVQAYLSRFVVFPSEHARTAVTLWAAHTHLVKCFDSTPRLALLSAEKQSGKTRTVEILELLCVGAEILNDASAAYLYRRIEAAAVTVLLDEADAIWKRGKSDDSAEALRSIVNCGHRKRGTVGRVEMVGKKGELVRYRVYAPVALAGIGDCLPDTILDRSVIVRMRRRAPDEPVEQFRQRTCRAEGEALNKSLAEWAAAVGERIGDPWPNMPAGVTDRPADVWEPLLAVADVAGGDWPIRARAACVAFVTGARDDIASVGVRLLTEIRDVWPGSGTSGTSGTSLASTVPQVPEVPAVGTDDLLGRLHHLDEAPWGDWYGKPLDARGLAKLLKGYGIKSTKVKIGDRSVRGYRRDDFWDAWRRYLPGGSATAATSTTSLASDVVDVAAVALPDPDLLDTSWAAELYDRE